MHSKAKSRTRIFNGLKEFTTVSRGWTTIWQISKSPTPHRPPNFWPPWKFPTRPQRLKEHDCVRLQQSQKKIANQWKHRISDGSTIILGGCQCYPCVSTRCQCDFRCHEWRTAILPALLNKICSPDGLQNGQRQSQACPGGPFAQARDLCQGVVDWLSILLKYSDLRAWFVMKR